MATKVSQQQKDEFKKAFSLFDRDGDGTITKDELNQVMLSLRQGLTEADLQDMIGDVDVNDDGLIDFDEFCNLMAGQSKDSDIEADLVESFKVLVRDGKSFSTAELRHVAKNLCQGLKPEELDAMIREVDPNNTGWVDYEQFEQMMTAK
mmetsp:Transcript_39505/g.99346  ORF Transcript_39505/g.99346 Transcript_39505/m.99346 type:complete len:149 (-) Transcript_39505:37-483(-)